MSRSIGFIRIVAAFSTAAMLVSACSAAFADELILKNGDHITGKIVSAADGKIQMAPDFAKSTTITVALDDIATFTASAPVVVKLKDGTVISQPIQKGPPGAIVIASGGSLAPQPIDVSAINQINPAVTPPVAWHGSIGANGLYSSSSTTSLLVGLSADAVRVTAQDQLAIKASYNYGEQKVDGLTTANANNWGAEVKYSYFILPKVYAYVDAQAAGDRVNFLNLQFTPSVGAGYAWINRPDAHFTTDAGLSWIYDDYKTAPQPTENAAISLAYHLDKSWDLGRVSLFNDFQVLPSIQGSQVVIIADAGLRTALTKSMYSEIRADVDYNSQPAPGAKSTSTQLKFGLGWTY